MPNPKIETIKPFFMYGTAWKNERTEACVSKALNAGFRAIDTANQRKHYYEAGVGAALCKAYESKLISRDDVFLQTKFTYIRGQDERLPYDPKAKLTSQVQQSFDSSLEHLQTDFIDSYLLHGPATASHLIDDDWEVWDAMESLHQQERVAVLGISNVSLQQLTELLDEVKVKPSFVQNRCYATRCWDKDIRELCHRHGIVYQGFSLLTANRHLNNNRDFLGIAQGMSRSKAQLIFRFARQLGMLPLTGTTDPEHMSEDLDIDDFELTDLEMEVIESIAA
jgi:diketogulonate reductase-like aldo/keto reductase